jgi:hypothetical protein
MIEDTVKQTRCTTCDAEHPYKGGQAPRRKRKDAPATAIVPPGVPEPGQPVAAAPADAPMPIDDALQDEDAAPGLPEIADDPAREVEEGPVHRPLIRATLPRPEGQKDVRTPPDFTVRQAGGRGGAPPGNQQFRGANRMRPRGGGNGHRPFGGDSFGNTSGGPRFGARPSQGQGHNRGQGGFRPAQQPRHGGGRKRSR